jgi:hypothetical protein
MPSRRPRYCVTETTRPSRSKSISVTGTSNRSRTFCANRRSRQFAASGAWTARTTRQRENRRARQRQLELGLRRRRDRGWPAGPRPMLPTIACIRSSAALAAASISDAQDWRRVVSVGAMTRTSSASRTWRRTTSGTPAGRSATAVVTGQARSDPPLSLSGVEAPGSGAFEGAPSPSRQSPRAEGNHTRETLRAAAGAARERDRRAGRRGSPC